MTSPAKRGIDLRAVVLAIGLLLVLRLTYGALAARLAPPATGTSTLLARLADIPLTLGTWRGEEQPLDDSLVRAARVERYLNRVYSDPATNRRITLYIAVGHTRDMIDHRPDVCFPGAGWTLDFTTPQSLKRAGGSEATVRIYRFLPAGLDETHMTVLGCYLLGGMIGEDVSLLRRNAWRTGADRPEAAQIMIACAHAGNSGDPDAAATLLEFAELLIEPLEALLQEQPVPTAHDANP